MLLDQKLLGPAFWDSALLAQSNAHNIVTLYNGMSLYLIMTGIMPDINDFKFAFGTPVVTYEQQESDPKFKPKGQFGIAVGGTYNGNHGTLVYIPDKGMKPVVRYNVKDLRMITRPIPMLEMERTSKDAVFNDDDNTAIFVTHKTKMI